MSESYVLLICEHPELAADVSEVVQAAHPGHIQREVRLEAALSSPQRDVPDLVLVHVTATTGPDEVARLVRRCAEESPPVPVILIGGAEATAAARTLDEHGPVESFPRIGINGRLARWLKLWDRPERSRGATALMRLIDPDAAPVSEAGSRALEQIRRVAPIDATILLSGEIGSGKSHAGRLIHEASNRRNRPFLTVNCGALSPSATEAEMFGVLRSPGQVAAGADRLQPGKFAEVGDGTLLLQNVEALSLPIQAKLLRAIESGLFEPVGSDTPQPMRARLIATTSRTLDQEVAAGRFRSDLYYRINVIEIPIPPLRHRAEEIPALAARFVAEFADRCGREVEGIAPDALDALVRHDWPGNIRELRNVLERAVVLGLSAQITLDDLKLKSPPTPRTLVDPFAPPSPATLADAKRDAEQTRIVEALRKHDNVRLYAARELGISRMTLYKKMYEYGLMERPQRDQAEGRSDDDAA